MRWLQRGREETVSESQWSPKGNSVSESLAMPVLTTGERTVDRKLFTVRMLVAKIRSAIRQLSSWGFPPCGPGCSLRAPGQARRAWRILANRRHIGTSIVTSIQITSVVTSSTVDCVSTALQNRALRRDYTMRARKTYDVSIACSIVSLRASCADCAAFCAVLDCILSSFMGRNFFVSCRKLFLDKWIL